jgi:hypothetical protein
MKTQNEILFKQLIFTIAYVFIIIFIGTMLGYNNKVIGSIMFFVGFYYFAMIFLENDEGVEE